MCDKDGRIKERTKLQNEEESNSSVFPDFKQNFKYDKKSHKIPPNQVNS